MPQFVIVFERPAITTFITKVTVDAPDEGSAKSLAEDRVIQGLVEFYPDPDGETEFTNGDFYVREISAG